MNGGYVKMYRSITKWQWYKSSSTTRVFLHLLFTVNYTNNGVKRGQRLTAYPELADELNLSFKAVRVAIEHLITTGEIVCKKVKKGVLITIVNFDKFQTLQTAEGHDEGHDEGRDENTAQSRIAKPKISTLKSVVGHDEGHDEGHDHSDTLKKERKENKKDIYYTRARAREENAVYGEMQNVKLTAPEYKRLGEQMGKAKADEYIDRLGFYIASKGKKYKSHYATIRNWYRKDNADNPQHNSSRSYDTNTLKSKFNNFD